MASFDKKRSLSIKVGVNLLFFSLFLLSPLYGEITVAAFYGADPVIIVREDGSATGFFPEILKELFPDEEIRFITDLSFQEAYQKVKNNEIDLLPAAVRTVERERDFTYNNEVFLVSWGELFVDHSNMLDDIFDVQFKKVGLMEGDQNGRNFITMMDNFDIPFTPVYFKDLSSMAQAVKLKDVDAMVGYSSFNAQGVLKSVGVVFSPTQAFLAMAKDGDSRILDEVDKRLAEMKKDNDSIYYEQIEKWFHYEEIVKRPPWLFPVLSSLSAVLILTLIVILILQLRFLKTKNDNLVKEKEFDEAMQKADLNHRIIAEHNYDWEFWITPDNKFIYCSPSCSEYTGYRPENFYKNPHLIESLIIPEDRQKWRDHHDDNSSREHSEYFRIQNKSGELRWLSHRCRHIFNDEGRFLGHRGSFIDITDQMRAESSLRESERKYRVLIENSGDMIWSLDKDLCIRYLNEKLLALIGSPENEILGEKCSSVFSPSDTIQAAKTFNECLYTEKAQYVNLSIENKRTGKTHILSIIATPHIDKEHGQSLICYGRDITEKYELELHIQRSQRLESLGIIAGGLAHDFNNLLTPISGYAELIKASCGDDENITNYVDMILSVSGKARNLVKKLLLFSKKETVNYEEIPINRLINNFYSMARSFLRKSVRLEFDICAEELFIYGDSIQIEQVLVNLIINAQDAIEKDGLIRVSLDRVRDTRVEINNEVFELPGKGFCRLIVEDTGSGMDEETRTKIFDPFFTTKNDKGSGLGLSSSFGIIKQLKGYIFVDSKVSEGTVFKIFIPLVLPN